MKLQTRPEFEPSRPPEITPEPDFPEKFPDPSERPSDPREPLTRPEKEPDTPFPDPNERPPLKKHSPTVEQRIKGWL